MRLEVWEGSVWIRSGTVAHGGGEGHVVSLGRRSLHCVLSAAGQSHWGLRHVGQVAVSVPSVYGCARTSRWRLAPCSAVCSFTTR